MAVLCRLSSIGLIAQWLDIMRIKYLTGDLWQSKLMDRPNMIIFIGESLPFEGNAVLVV